MVLTTSPPSSTHFVGAAVKRATGVRWVADLRDSITAHPHRLSDSRLAAVKARGTAWRRLSPAMPMRSLRQPSRSPMK